MKRIIAFSLATLFLSASCTSKQVSTTKGNKNLVKKEIAIEDYSSITLSGTADVIYEMKEDSPAFLSLEIDKNLVDNIDISCKDKNLIIKQKRNMSPSKYIIRTNSKNISSLDISGAGDITTVGTVKTDNLTINVRGAGNLKMDNLTVQSLISKLSGSGDINIKGKAKVTNANITLSGASDADIKNIEANAIKITISGAGDIYMAGNANAVEYIVSGTGDIDAKSLEVKEAKCIVSGNGDISVFATKKLEAKVSGNGDIKYKGKPSQIEKKKSGNGTISEIK